MRKPGPLTTVLICIALLAVATVQRVWPADAPDAAQGPDVLIIVQPLDARGEEFRQVITDAVRIQLESRGLSVAFSQKQRAEGGPAGGGPLEQARARNAPVAIDCSYSLVGNEIAVSMGWYETRSDSLTARAQARGRIGLRLDTAVLEALDSILSASKERVGELSAARKMMNSAASAAERQAGSEGADPGQPEPAAQSGGAQRTDKLTGAGGLAAAKKPTTQLLLVGGFAPFISTGAAGYYFTLGYLPSLLASLMFDTAAGKVGIGLYTGMNYFKAQGTEDSSDNFMIPAGVDVRYELTLSRLLFSLHLTGGPATLVVLTASGHTYVNLMPFLKSGIGAEFLLLPWLGISMSVDYEIYFEVPYLFMGITPSFGMSFRL